MTRAALALVLLAATASAPRAQEARPAARDTTQRDLGRVVVTASRAVERLEDVPVPTTVVTAEQAEADGSIRLGDLLQSVPGLALTSGFGTGIQLQGLDPAYTLVLLDGQPLVGRTAGVFDLDRVALAGVDRVEIVRGPSSSLYGSEALAGVVNLITRAPREPRLRLRARTGTFATTAFTAEAEGGTGRVGARVLLDRFATDGYDLDPAVFGPTTPEVTEQTADLRLRARLGDRTRFRLGARATTGDQRLSYAFTDVLGGVDEIDQTERRTDWTIHPEVRTTVGGRWAARASGYLAGYRLDTDVVRRADGVQTYDESFDQRLAKVEGQADALWSVRHRTVLGAGLGRDALAGERFGADAPTALNGFAFVQHDWEPSQRFALNASARLDAFSDFGARLSPKLAALVRPSEATRVRLSVGSGFKAPDFRQLYLSFTNDVGGYTIFGATRAASGLDRIEAEGRLVRRYLDADAIGRIEPETSLALNAEVEADLAPGLRAALGAFRNGVDGLIDVQPIAEMTGGAPVYGYVNVDRIRTEGLTADVSAYSAVVPGLSLALGYQWLRTRDLDLVDALRQGTVFGRTETGRDVRLGVGDYGNLLGRSAHSGTVRLAYDAQPWTASLRARLRSRYGLRDLDGNGFANRDDEFVPATTIADVAVSRAFDLPTGRLRAQLGVDNLFDTTRPALVPSLAGRRVYGALDLTF